MTMMLNTVTTFASAQTAQSAPASRAAGKVAAAAQAAPAASQAAPAAGQAAAPAAAQPFAQWMGRQAAGAQAASQATAQPAAPSAAQPADSVLDAVAGQVDGAPAKAANSTANANANAPAQDTTADAGDGQSAAVQPDGALLAAMAMPLMPLSPAQVAQAVQAAQGKGPQSGARTDDAAARTVAAAGQDDARRTALTQPALAALATLQPPQQPQQPVAPAQASQPVQQPAQHEGEAAAVRLAVQAAGTNTTGKDGSTDGGSTPGGGNAVGAAAQLGAAMSAPPSTAQPAAGTVTLAGPPTAWRQSLQEALGERLQLQVGNNVEQAVIRLEPPQLGQIDIAIRHSAGSLEVSISATNSEVLRQLQGVSDNLRSDLSQRQFSDVAVTVAPAPRNQAAPFGDPQQQGRGRQQGREQDEYEPGRGLAEAGNPASAFSLG